MAGLPAPGRRRYPSLFTAGSARRAHAGPAILLLLSLCSWSPGSLGGAAASPSTSFRIPAQSLETALLEFAEQSGTRMLYDSGLTAGLATQGVEGRYTPADALSRLLAGTGLAPRTTDTGAAALERVAQSDPPAAPAPGAPASEPPACEAPIVLPVLTVTGQPWDDTSYNVQDATTDTETDTPIMETPVSIQWCRNRF